MEPDGNMVTVGVETVKKQIFNHLVAKNLQMYKHIGKKYLMLL